MGRRPNGYWSDFDVLLAEAQKYSTKREFELGSKGAYNAAHKHARKKELFAHFDVAVHSVWSDFDVLLAEARKYRTKTEFHLGSRGAYNAAFKHARKEELFAHFDVMKRVWSTFDDLLAEAQKYRTKNAFKIGSRGAYDAARKHARKKELFAHFELVNRVWSDFDVLLAEAQKYRTKNEFYLGSQGAYKAAHKHVRKKELFDHFDVVVVHRVWSDFDVLLAEAQKYRTKNEFYLGSRGAYNAAHKHARKKELFAHFEEVKGYNPYLKTRLYYYVIQMYVYVGITNDWENRHEQHLENPHNEWTSRLAQCGMPTYFTCRDKHTRREVIMEHPDRKVVERLERLAIRRAVSLGYWVVNKDYNPQFDPATGTYSWEKLAIAA